MNKRRPWAMPGVWIALLLISALPRWYGLDRQGLWSDELFSASLITQVGEGQPWYHYVPKIFPDLRIEDSALTWKAGENSPPLFEALLWLWTRVWGESDFAMRSLSTLASTLTPLVLFAGLRKPLGVWPALGAALLMALSPFAIAYAQEVRGYALLMLLAAWAVVRLVRYALLDEAGRPSFKGDVAVYVLLSYTHYTGLVLACGLVALRFCIAWKEQRSLREFGWFVLLPVLVAPWLYLNWYSMSQTGSGRFGWRDYAWSDVWAMMLPKVGGLFVPSVWALCAVLALLALGLLAAGRQMERRTSVVDWRWGLVCGFVVLLVLHFGYGIYTAFSARVWHERYFAVMLPVGMVGFGLCASLTYRVAVWPGLAFAVAAVASAMPLADGNFKAWKEEYREASSYIAQHVQDRPIVVATWASNAIYFNYYLRASMAHEGKAYRLMTVGAEGDLEAGVAQVCKQAQENQGRQLVLFQHKMHRLYFELLNQRCAGAWRWVSGQEFRGVFVDFYEPVLHSTAPLREPKGAE